MTLDHKAIYKAYPNVTSTNDELGAFDKDGKKITLVQSKIDTARAELNTAATAIVYKATRKSQYPEIGDQLDMQYWDKKNGTNKWVEAVDKVKSDNPKP